MEKTTFLLFLLLSGSFIYLTVQLNSNPLEINDNSISSFPENTYLKLTGTPTNIRTYPEEITFKINNVSIRARTSFSLSNKSAVIFGKVNTYENQTYIRVEKIKYDT
ncbi:MAG TPA: hypothetical protein VHA12_00745 [Candidatus Nanoarchaeia archaeon]|nr:hypothetical protein [Candidatus Nanoarchaeia archaeon]